MTLGLTYYVDEEDNDEENEMNNGDEKTPEEDDLDDYCIKLLRLSYFILRTVVALLS